MQTTNTTVIYAVLSPPILVVSGDAVNISLFFIVHDIPQNHNGCFLFGQKELILIVRWM